MAFTLQTLREQAAAGEDSTRQFKSRIDNADSLAAEMAAFANANGGVIFIGVQDDGTLSGITSRELHDANQLIGNAAQPACPQPACGADAEHSSRKWKCGYRPDRSCRNGPSPTLTGKASSG